MTVTVPNCTIYRPAGLRTPHLTAQPGSVDQLLASFYALADYYPYRRLTPRGCPKPD